MRDVSCLDRYPSFRSSDSAVARELLFSVYGADRFDSRNPNFGVRANFANLTSIGLAFCAYAGAASVSFPESNIVRQFFAIDGTASFRAKAASRPIAGWSPMIAGDSRLDLDFQAGYRQLVVRIDAGALERLLKSIIADDSDRRLSFVEDDSDPAVMALARQDVFRFAEELDRFGQNYSPTAIAELERSLMVRLLLAHRHNFSRQLHDAPPRANRSVVDIVESYIEAHWDQPLDLEKIAAIANVGVRTVFRVRGIRARLAGPVCPARPPAQGSGIAEAPRSAHLRAVRRIQMRLPESRPLRLRVPAGNRRVTVADFGGRPAEAIGFSVRRPQRSRFRIA